MNPPMQDDDGFGDFRAKVKGLPPEQRRAALTQLEEAIVQNLRTNMLADLYDQPTPAPAPRQPPTGDSDLDARLGRTPRDAVDTNTPEYKQYLSEYEDELRAGGMSEDDPEWQSAMDNAPSGYNPTPQGTTPMRQPTRQPMPQQRPQSQVPEFRKPTGNALWDEKSGADIYAFQDENGYGDFVDANGLTADSEEADQAFWSQPGMREKFDKFRANNTNASGGFARQPQGQRPMVPPRGPGGQQTYPGVGTTSPQPGMGRQPRPPMSIIDDPEPEALQMAEPTKFQTPQGGRPQMSDQQMQDRGRTIMGPGGQQQPAWGSGDGFVDKNDPDQPPYTSPLPRGSMRGKPYPSEREFGGGDAYYSQLYRWQKDNGAPEWQEGTNDGGPEWKSFVDEYHRKNNLPPPVDKNKFREFLGQATGLSGQELHDVMLGHSDAVSQEEYDALLEKFRNQGKPNPRGAFGVPPGRKPSHPIGAF